MRCAARWGLVLVLIALQGCGGSGDSSSGGGSGGAADATAPTIPAGLTATASSATQVQLTWTAATDAGAGVAGYHVFRNAGTTAIATVSATSYLDTGLTASTAYTYTVRAFDAATPANESAASAVASVTTPAATGPVLSGLDARPSNTSCLAGDAPAGSIPLALDQVFAGVGTFSVPLLMLQAPGNTANWYVVQKTGIVYTFANQANAASKRVFVDVGAQIAVNASDPNDERGLLGMAFHPNYPANPRAYLFYSANAGSQLVSRVVEYQTRDGGQTLDATSGVTILQLNKPESNHNGGHIAFGPDGYLYIGTGDGGGGGDVHGSIGNGQRLSSLLGKILRIDVNVSTGGTRYAIPAGNPYAGGTVCNNDTGAFTANCPEIYAYGFRNPWRWSFDSGSGELWVGDVGQNTWEEVDRVVAGGNYGWRCREGAHDFNATCGGNAGSAIDPIAEYSHSYGIAVTGGYVYRGSAIPALAGRYVFGDYGSGRIWQVAHDAVLPTQEVTSGFDSGLNISSFAQDPSGEIYVVNLGGTLHKLRAGTVTGRVIPAQLSATGCVNAGNATQAASGLIPYAPNAAFWSDGAVKTRFLALPDGQKINIAQDGDFDLPTGTVLMKNFRIGSQLVETRLLMRHNDGQWAGYTYEWNAQGTDATRVVGGKSVQVAGQSWLFPSETQCLFCHSSAAGRSLGLETVQLNGSLVYAATGRTANQLDTLSAIGTLSAPLTAPPAQLPALPDPYGTAGTLNDRARAYLHANCSHCHRPNGPTPVDMDLRYTTALADTHACEVAPTRGDLGVANARRIAVGGADAAGRSLIVVRPGRTDSNSMPPLQPRVVDAAGVALLTSWVNSLTSCN
ncbi:MAG TPA: PQQ-dependent sugar dehydrogenase [Steroidobacteraceae bacterium]|nr:PQQ-dependent sugar dehydrogenase [Steroidobacteraceae bacterium]